MNAIVFLSWHYCFQIPISNFEHFVRNPSVIDVFVWQLEFPTSLAGLEQLQ